MTQLEPTNSCALLPARIPRERVPALYRWIAPLHDGLAVLVESRARAFAIERAGIVDGMNILEVAAGTGLTFRELLRRNPSGHTTGVDITPAMLRRARRRARRSGTTSYTLMHCDAYALDFPDAAFDLVMNSYMFDLLPETDFVPVLEEFRRVLRPGGRLVQINMTAGRAWYNRIWEGLYRLHPALLGGCRGVCMAPYLEQAGFVDVERVYISQRTFPSEVVWGTNPG